MSQSAVVRRRSGALAVGAALLGLGTAALAQPANNNCGNAISIGEGTVNGTTIGATQDATITCVTGSAPDVWYRFVAPLDGTLTLQTCGGAGWDTTVAVFDGCPAAGGLQLACMDDGCSVQTYLQTDIDLGQEYWIRVGGFGSASGAFALNVDAAESPGGGTGADVVYTDIDAAERYGPVGQIYAYSLGTYTCNIGTANLRWGNSWNGSPAVGFNAYKLRDGRLIQVGMSFCKQACCAAAGGGCGMACNGVGGSMLGVGCRDYYWPSYNASQSRLGPRSQVNAYTGAFPITNTGSGDAIFRRLQIHRDHLDTLLNPGAQYFLEGVYVASDDAPSGNAMNNASYKRATISAFNFTMAGTTQVGVPAIQAWRDHGLGANTVDNSVQLGHVDVPGEGRFHYAHKVRDLGNGRWLYDYAVFNLNSDRSGGSLTVPVTAGVNVTGVGFNDVNYHSGEPYANTDWTVTVDATGVTWASPQTFAQNPNSNALRWGTMYNFWFEADRPPTTGSVTLGLFKPHTPQAVQFSASVPAPPAYADGDTNCDGLVDFFDIDAFLLALFDAAGYAAAYPACAPLGTADVNNDGSVDFFDIDAFLLVLFP